MKGKCLFLAVLLAISGAAAAISGLFIKYIILEPRGLERSESVVALPFVLMRDEGLQYVLSDLGAIEEEPMPIPRPTIPSITQPMDASEPADPADPNPEPERNVLDKVLFIGDSRTCGLRDHARLNGADYFCDVGMTVFNVKKASISDRGFRKTTLSALLGEREYTCVVISLGLNEAGYPINSLIRAYGELLTAVIRTQPQAAIILQGVMTVGKKWASHTPYASPENLDAINRSIEELADGYYSFYIDPNERFADEQNYLPDSMTADGCHLYAKYTALWSDWICQSIEEIGEANGI